MDKKPYSVLLLRPREYKCTRERNGQGHFNGSLSENQRAGAIFVQRRRPRGLGVWAIDALQCDSNQSDEGAGVGRDEHRVAWKITPVRVTAAP